MAERRRRNSGSIRKTAHGRYEARWRDENAVQRSRTFESQSEAQDYLDEARSRIRKIRLGLEVPVEDRRPFGEACDQWLVDRKGKDSIKTDASIIRVHLRPAFGAIELRRLNKPMIDRFCSIREDDGLSKNTINHHLVLLGSILRHAVSLGWLRENQIPPFKKYTIRDTDFSYLKNNAEIAAFLASARADEYAGAFPIYATLLYTGMRIGELAGLTKRDVDFSTRLITVKRSYDSDDTKGGETRYVPILDPLLPILRAQYLASKTALLFTSRGTKKREGTMLRKDARVFDEILERVLVRAGFDAQYISAHDLRHSFASWWLITGGDIFKLSKILGHKSLAVTMRYSHLCPAAYASDYARLPDLRPQDAAIIPLREVSDDAPRNVNAFGQKSGDQV